MTRNIQLLKQVRAVTRNIDASTDNPEHKALLSVADILLNELMLQEDGRFYADLVQQGSALLHEGEALAMRLGHAVARYASGSLPGAMHRIDAIDAEVERLFDALASIVGTLDEDRSAEEKDWLSRVTRWENRLYQNSLRDLASAPEASAIDITRERLEAYLDHKFPELGGVVVTKFVTLAGGISKKTILFETDKPVYGTQSLVIRAEQPVNLLHYDGSDVALEFYMIRLMQQHGMPVAEPLWLEADARHLGVRFIVSRKAEGSVIGGNFGPYQPLTPGQAESFLANYFKLHGIRLDPDDPLVRQSHLNVWMLHKTIREVAKFYAAEYLPTMIRRAGIKTTPEMLRALRWLERNAPDCDEPPVIIHFDYAFNNMIFDGDRMTALLDWETSRLADPADDFIWTQPNLGLYPMDEFRRVYRQGTGRDVTEYRIAYAALAKCLVNLIAGRTGLKYINESDSAPLHMGMMAYKFMPMLGANVDELIATAESLRGR